MLRLKSKKKTYYFCNKFSKIVRYFHDQLMHGIFMTNIKRYQFGIHGEVRLKAAYLERRVCELI